METTQTPHLNELLLRLLQEMATTNRRLNATNKELLEANEQLQTTNDELRARTAELQDLATMLESERRRLTEVVELAPFYIIVLRGPYLWIETINSRYTSVLGGQEVQGQLFEDVAYLFVDPKVDIVDLAREAYRSNRVKATPPILTMLPNDRGQPVKSYLVYTLVPIHTAASEVDGLVLYATDVTEQRMREAEEERKRLKLIFERADQVLVALYDAETTHLIMGSPAYLMAVQRAHGIDPREAVGRPWHELTLAVPKDRTAEVWRQVLRDGKPYRLPEVRVKFPDDASETVWDWSITPIEGSEQSGTPQFLLVSAIEITEQVRAREELERLDHLKDEFLTLASHELRTPLTPLSGYADMLQRLISQVKDGNQPPPYARMEQLIGRFSDQLLRLNRLVGDLVDVGRLQSGKFTLDQRPVLLLEMIRQAQEDAKLLSASHSVEVETMDGSEELKVVGDRERLLQVMLNLIQNAITYAPQSERIVIRLTKHSVDGDEAATADPNSAQIEVQDYGPGIAPEDQERLFSRFYQVDRSDRPARRGLGLGLFICKQIVEQHGGTIAVKSTVGRGTTFLVRLPLLIAS